MISTGGKWFPVNMSTSIWCVDIGRDARRNFLEELYSSAYAFILPSDVEGMAISLLEAMSYGNCCLVSDICENTEVVEDKALTFRKGNVKDLRAKLEYLLQNPEVVEAYKKQSSDFICGKYNWDDVVEQTLDVYKRSAGRRKKRIQ